MTMKPQSVLLICFSLAALFGASGCASFQVQPTAASITMPHMAKPIPVTIGITQTEQKVTGGFPDLVPGFRETLTQSGLFQNVYYPVRATDKLDGSIGLHLSARFHPDGALFPKSFLTGFLFFLPAPIVTYDHEYQAECTLDLTKGNRTLKSYTAQAVVTVSCKLLAPPDRIEAEGTQAVQKLLWSELIGQLNADRAFLERELAPKLVAIP